MITYLLLQKMSTVKLKFYIDILVLLWYGGSIKERVFYIKTNRCPAPTKQNRRTDLLITNQLLYQLSYTSTISSELYSNRGGDVCQ